MSDIMLLQPFKQINHMKKKAKKNCKNVLLAVKAFLHYVLWGIDELSKKALSFIYF